MRLIKHFLISCVALFIILLIISLWLPSRVSVSKSILLSVSKDSVSNALLQIKTWQNWNPVLQDKNTTYHFLDNNSVTWTSADNNVNTITLQHFSEDSISMVVITNNKQIFESGFNVIKNTDNSGLTKVDWWISENLKWYPWEKFYGLFSESLKETYIENILKAFKEYVENK
jgi:hypothetical protein